MDHEAGERQRGRESRASGARVASRSPGPATHVPVRPCADAAVRDPLYHGLARRSNVSPELIVGTRAELAEALAERLERDVPRRLAEAGRFSLGLPGGSVADTSFPRLARARVDWSSVDFFWGDERAVPPGDPESNYGLAQRLWLAPAGVPSGRIHRMPADANDLAGAAALYEEEMTRALGTPARLDLALLGVGPDGHVCSLFPGHALLAETRRLVAALEDSPKPPPRRLTLTLPALAAAQLVVVAAFGDAKAAAVREGLRDPGSRLPVALATRAAAQVLWLLDPGAARLL